MVDSALPYGPPPLDLDALVRRQQFNVPPRVDPSLFSSGIAATPPATSALTGTAPAGWSYGNPTGTEQLRGTYVGMPTGSLDEVVDPAIARWPGRPITRGEYGNLQDASLEAFNQAGLLAGDAPEVPTPMMAAARRVRATPGPPRGPRAAPSPAEGLTPPVPEGPPTPAPTPATPPEPASLTSSVESTPGYVYHATNADRLQHIADSGKLQTHRPGDFTDQNAWPDGSTQKRNYFTPSAENTWQFAPEEGKPVLLRMPQDAHPVQAERGTGDLYSTKPVPADKLEYHGADGNWHPVVPKPSEGAVTPPPPPEAAPPPAPAPEPEPAAPAIEARSPGLVTDTPEGIRGMRAVPNLRNLTPTDAAAIAQTNPHLIQRIPGDPNSGFIGAPQWIRNMDDVNAMRRDIDSKVDAGAHGRDWYLNERKWIGDITGLGYDPATEAISYGNPEDARRVAESLANFSNQANPNSNLQFHMQAWNPWSSGGARPEIVHTGQQARTFYSGMDAMEAQRLRGEEEGSLSAGMKQDPFGINLTPGIPYGTTGVNDIWHARNFGYTNPDGTIFDGSPSDTMHKWMDYETVQMVDRANRRKAGGFDDWNAANVQAAPWVANKEADLRRRFQTGKPNPWSDERIRAEAKDAFSAYAPNVTAHSTFEEAPGESTGLGGYYSQLTPQQQQTYTQRANWMDPVTGRDRLTGQMFLQPPMRQTYGTYENSAGQFETNPGFTQQPMVDYLSRTNPETGKKTPGPLRMNPITQQALQTTATVRGTMGAQEITPWHTIDTRAGQRVQDMDSLRLTDVDPTREQMNAVAAIGKNHGFYVAHTGDGISLLNAGEKEGLGGAYASPQPGKDLMNRLRGGLQAELERALPGVKVTPGNSIQGGAFLTDALAKVNEGKGMATTEMLNQLEQMRQVAPRWYDQLVNGQGAKAYAADKLAALQEAGMSDVRPDYVNLLKIISRGSLQAVVDHVRKNGAAGLPAVLAAVAAGRGIAGGQQQ